MGTKNRPGIYDCYGSAEDDEHIFVLRANDPLASHFVDLWAAISAGEIIKAVGHFWGIVLNFGDRYQQYPRDEAKIAEATRTAEDMRDWYCTRHPQGTNLDA